MANNDHNDSSPVASATPSTSPILPARLPSEVPAHELAPAAATVRLHLGLLKGGRVQLLITTGSGDQPGLLEELMRHAGSDFRFSRCEAAQLDFDRLLAFLCRDLQLRGSPGNRPQRLKALKTYFEQRADEGALHVLAIDQAQTLDRQTLNHCLRFWQILGKERPLLRLLLCGGPQLLDRLFAPDVPRHPVDIVLLRPQSVEVEGKVAAGAAAATERASPPRISPQQPRSQSRPAPGLWLGTTVFALMLTVAVVLYGAWRTPPVGSGSGEYSGGIIAAVDTSDSGAAGEAARDRELSGRHAGEPAGESAPAEPASRTPPAGLVTIKPEPQPEAGSDNLTPTEASVAQAALINELEYRWLGERGAASAPPLKPAPTFAAAPRMTSPERFIVAGRNAAYRDGLDASASTAAVAETYRRRGERLLAGADVVAARRWFMACYEAGVADCLNDAAGTYDPLRLNERGLDGVRPDPELAMRYYQQALEQGVSAARAQLERLREWYADDLADAATPAESLDAGRP